MRTLIESGSIEESIDGGRGYRWRIAAGIVCALATTALLFGGYLYLRNRHAQQTKVAEPPPDDTSAAQPKGPIKAEVFVDEPLLEGDQTIIGGIVKNVSSEELAGVLVDLELKRRKDAGTEKRSVSVVPAKLASQEEGQYSLRVRSADYSHVRLLAVRGGADSAQLAYAQSSGKKRPPEKLEGKTIIVNRPPPSKGGFLNTPDNPARIP